MVGASCAWIADKDTLARTRAVSESGPKGKVDLAALPGASSELLASSTGAALLVGNEIPSGAEPLALAYAGHQFGGLSAYVPDVLWNLTSPRKRRPYIGDARRCSRA